VRAAGSATVPEVTSMGRPPKVALAGQPGLVAAYHRVLERDQGLGNAVCAAVAPEGVLFHGQ
jgi:hypothetical protein